MVVWQLLSIEKEMLAEGRGIYLFKALWVAFSNQFFFLQFVTIEFLFSKNVYLRFVLR